MPDNPMRRGFVYLVAIVDWDARKVLKDKDIRISMDGNGRWVDNVVVERLWRGVKYEHVFLHDYETIAEARAKIGAYLEFFNERWPFSSFDLQTPDMVYFKTQHQARVA